MDYSALSLQCCSVCASEAAAGCQRARAAGELCPLFHCWLVQWAHVQNWSSEGGLPDRSMTRLHFQDTKMHQAAQAEHMEVQKRGNHGTLSAQLHNEKSNLLAVSILHVMFSGPVAEPLAPSDQLSLPTCRDPSLGESASRRDGGKTAHKYVSQ